MSLNRNVNISGQSIYKEDEGFIASDSASMRDIEYLTMLDSAGSYLKNLKATFDSAVENYKALEANYVKHCASLTSSTPAATPQSAAPAKADSSPKQEEEKVEQPKKTVTKATAALADF